MASPGAGSPLAEPLLRAAASRSISGRRMPLGYGSQRRRVSQAFLCLTGLSIAAMRVLYGRYTGDHKIAAQDLFTLAKVQVPFVRAAQTKVQVPLLRVAAPASRMPQVVVAKIEGAGGTRKIKKGREGRQRKVVSRKEEELQEEERQRRIQERLEAYRAEKRLEREASKANFTGGDDARSSADDDAVSNGTSGTARVPAGREEVFCRSGRFRPGLVVELNTSDEVIEELGDSLTGMVLHFYSAEDHDSSSMLAELAQAAKIQANTTQQPLRFAKVNCAKDLWRPYKAEAPVKPLTTFLFIDASGNPSQKQEGLMKAEEIAGFVSRQLGLKVLSKLKKGVPGPGPMLAKLTGPKSGFRKRAPPGRIWSD